jgi:hypothetical protein
MHALLSYCKVKIYCVVVKSYKGSCKRARSGTSLLLLLHLKCRNSFKIPTQRAQLAPFACSRPAFTHNLSAHACIIPHCLTTAATVFQVNTLSGAEVWRRRHYRVRRGKAPGLFNLSVSDNGVTSLEAWRIIACAEDFR